MDIEMLEYCQNEFVKYLEQKGIDTTLFMGFGYDLNDVLVGSEFYISYSFWCRDSDFKRSNSDNKFFDTLKNCLIGRKESYPEFELNDKWVLISKYRYFDNKIWGGKDRRDFVAIKNLRTKEIKILNEDWIRCFYLFYFETTWNPKRLDKAEVGRQKTF